MSDQNVKSEAKGYNNVADKSREGFFWLASGQAVAHAIQFITSIIIARVLFPADYGLMSMAVTFAGIASAVGDFGISSTLIQKYKTGSGFFQAAFLLNLVGAILIGLAQFLLAPLAVRFYGVPQVGDLMRVLAFNYPLVALFSTHSAYLEKNLRFQAVTLINLSRRLLTSLGTILLALRGFGVWSFVVPVIVVDALSAPVYWMISPYAPGLSLRHVRQHAREIIKYGKFATGNSVLSYVVKNADYLLIGKLLNPVALGFYTFAYEKSMFLSRSLLGPVHKVSFPAFSLLKENNDELYKAYVKLMRVITLFTFPFVLFAMVHGDIFIVSLFGIRWTYAIVPFQLIGVYALVNSLTSSSGSLLYALGKPDVDFKVMLLMIPPLLVGSYMGARTYGIIGVAAAIAIIQSCFSIMKIYISFRLMNWRVKTLWEIIWRNLLFASLAALASWLVRLQSGLLNTFSLLAITFLVFVVVFLLAKLTFDQEGMEVLWSVLLPQRVKLWSMQNLPYWLRAGLCFPGARKTME